MVSTRRSSAKAVAKQRANSTDVNQPDTVGGVAKSNTPTTHPHPSHDNLSNYGSDFDTDGEEAVRGILAQVEGAGTQLLVLESLDEQDVAQQPSLAHVPLFSSQSSKKSAGFSNHSGPEELGNVAATLRIQHDIRVEDIAETLQKREEGQLLNNDVDADIVKNEKQLVEDVTATDSRSPLDRFRSPPKKPLSVTDLVSPVWCELQYWYTLTKHGKKKRTPAMKQGSVVHKTLELEVHDFVPVETKTREDRFGLDLWNVISGLRTLRLTGLTRELSVWDIVDGELVRGIIDEMSHICPDLELEDSLATSPEIQGTKDQKPITDFFMSGVENGQGWLGTPHASSPKVYLIDCKTTDAKRVPALKSMRSAQMQLMLYRRMLVSLATNNVSADAVFDRLRLDGRVQFSDVFMKEIASLGAHSAHPDFDSDAGRSSDPPEAQIPELFAYNNLTLLWSLMIQEFAETIPNADAVGTVLAAEFRSRTDGHVIGRRSFAYEQKLIDDYVRDEMAWWRGEREARGVEIEDAFKCQSCEFAEECEWRIKKIDEAVSKSRARKKPIEKVV